MLSRRIRQLVPDGAVVQVAFEFLHFQRRVSFRDPVFDLAVKLGSLDKDLLRFGLRRDVGEGVVDGISLSPAGLEIVGVLLRRFAQHKFRAF